MKKVAQLIQLVEAGAISKERLAAALRRLQRMVERLPQELPSKGEKAKGCEITAVEWIEEEDRREGDYREPLPDFKGTDLEPFMDELDCAIRKSGTTT